MTKIKRAILTAFILLSVTVTVSAQEPGFTLSLKNGSTLRGGALAREEGSGRLRLTMTESNGTAKSYAVVAAEDIEAIRASSAGATSIKIKLLDGSELMCKEFSLSGDILSVKLGTASRLEIPWDQVESVNFGQ
jgi:hypothetical protein